MLARASSLNYSHCMNPDGHHKKHCFVSILDHAHDLLPHDPLARFPDRRHRFSSHHGRYLSESQAHESLEDPCLAYRYWAMEFPWGHSLAGYHIVLVERQLLSTSVENYRMKGDSDMVAMSALRRLAGSLLV